jgi:hypothetical protein
VTEGEAGGCVCGMAEVGALVLPCVDEETVQAAEGGEEDCGRQQSDSQAGLAGDGGDEDGCGEEDANGDLFGEAVRATGGVDEGGGLRSRGRRAGCR